MHKLFKHTFYSIAHDLRPHMYGFASKSTTATRIGKCVLNINQSQRIFQPNLPISNQQSYFNHYRHDQNAHLYLYQASEIENLVSSSFSSSMAQCFRSCSSLVWSARSVKLPHGGCICSTKVAREAVWSKWKLTASSSRLQLILNLNPNLNPNSNSNLDSKQFRGSDTNNR